MAVDRNLVYNQGQHGEQLPGQSEGNDIAIAIVVVIFGASVSPGVIRYSWGCLCLSIDEYADVSLYHAECKKKDVYKTIEGHHIISIDGKLMQG